jgi:isopentenyl phosphate kinase
MLRFFADRLLFDPQDKDNPLRIEAGKALIALVAPTSHGDVFPNIQQLVRIMSCDACSKDYRAVTAQILAQMCARSRSRADHQDRINRLNSVANALSKVDLGSS